MVYPALLPLMPHTSAASSRLNWRPPADLNGLVRFARKMKSGFCACTITFQLASTRFYMQLPIPLSNDVPPRCFEPHNSLLSTTRKTHVLKQPKNTDSLLEDALRFNLSLVTCDVANKTTKTHFWSLVCAPWRCRVTMRVIGGLRRRSLRRYMIQCH